MITTNSGQNTQFHAAVSGATLLIDLDFAGGALYVTTFSVPVVANGHTYTAVGNLLSVSDFRESEVLATDKLSLKLSLVSTAMLAFAVGSADVYRGRSVKIYLQLLNDKWVPVENPILRWSGFMDKVRINRQTSPEGSGTGSIEMVCQRGGLARFRNALGFRMTHAQQQQDYPGDMGLEYTETLLTNPPPWMSKRFQFQEE